MKERVKTSQNSKALVLNSGMIPIDVISWTDAITSTWITGRGRVVAEYPDMFVRTGYGVDGTQGIFNIPSVIQYPHVPSTKIPFVKTLNPTPENLLKREGYKCCYCKRKINADTGTIEHVYPQSKGGLDDWFNLRMACTNCNGKKGDSLLSELGWELKPLPIPFVTAEVSKSIIHQVGGRVLDESWRPYIYWEVVWK